MAFRRKHPSQNPFVFSFLSVFPEISTAPHRMLYNLDLHGPRAKMQEPVATLLLLACVTIASALASSGTVLQRQAATEPDVYETRFDGVTWDNAKWQLSTTTLDKGHYQARMTVANGYHGINVASLGPFFERDVPVDGDVIGGWPLFNRRQTFATIAGFWDSQPYTNGPYDNGTNFPWLVRIHASSTHSLNANVSLYSISMVGKAQSAAYHTGLQSC